MFLRPFLDSFVDSNVNINSSLSFIFLAVCTGCFGKETTSNYSTRRRDRFDAFVVRDGEGAYISRAAK